MPTGMTPGGKPKRSYPTKPKKTIDYKLLQSYAERRMSTREMAIALGISENRFFEYQRKDKKFRDAVQNGRTAAIATAAASVLRHVSSDPKIALEYLKRFADEWKDPKIVARVVHSGAVGNVHINVDEIDDATCLRMAQVFIQTHGGAEAE